MKNTSGHEGHQSKPPVNSSHNHRPENKDNLDSRENLELNDGAGGHNTKDTHEGDEAKSERNDKRGSKPKS